MESPGSDIQKNNAASLGQLHPPKGCPHWRFSFSSCSFGSFLGAGYMPRKTQMAFGLPWLPRALNSPRPRKYETESL